MNIEEVKHEKCGRCKTWRLPKQFLNHKGRKLKTCDVCRGRYKCDKCDYKTVDKKKIKRHIKAVHDKIKDFECDKCDYKCSINSHLKRHINSIHNKKLWRGIKVSKGDYILRSHWNVDSLKLDWKYIDNRYKLHINEIDDYIIKAITRLRKQTRKRVFQKYNIKSGWAQLTLRKLKQKAHERVTRSSIVKTIKKDNLVLEEYKCYEEKCSFHNHKYVLTCECGSTSWKRGDIVTKIQTKDRPFSIYTYTTEHTKNIICDRCGLTTEHFADKLYSPKHEETRTGAGCESGTGGFWWK